MGMQIYLELGITSIPRCLSELDQLQVLLIDECNYLTDIPLSIFALPQIELLSIVRSNVGYGDLMRYNLPDAVDINDTLEFDDWLTDNFEYSANATYWLVFSPLCDESYDFGSSSDLEIFVSDHCDYPVYLLKYFVQCLPWQIGDGKCDAACNYHSSFLNDGGDCNQLCF